MKQSIFGSEKAVFIKRLNSRKIICTVLLCTVIAINTVLTVLRTDQNHTLLLWLNIVLDVAAAWFLIGYISLWVLPQQRLLRLCNGTERTFEGTVTSITAQTQRVRHMDCFTVTLDADKSQRQLFLPANTALSLTEGDYVQLTTVSNIIVTIT